MCSFYGWVIFHCIYVPQLLYPFICWWTSRLLPCLRYWKLIFRWSTQMAWFIWNVLKMESRAPLLAQMVKNLPAMRSLDWDDPLEKGMATHSSILAWRIPRTEEPDGLQSIGLQRVGHNRVNNTFTFLLFFSPCHHEMKILHMPWQLDFPTTCITGLRQQSLKLSYASILSKA